MSFDGTAVSLGTLAHELGHSMHSYLAWETQPQISSRYSLFVAEVASNFHQVLLRAHLLETIVRPRAPARRPRRGDGELPPLLLRHADARALRAGDARARRERGGAHRGAPGRADGRPLRRGVRAPSFDRERVGITWAQFSHLYAPFYVYQYATGISGAHALGNRVLAGEPGAAERYLDFLRAGGSATRSTSCATPGSTSPRASRSRRFAVLASLVDRLEQLA